MQPNDTRFFSYLKPSKAMMESAESAMLLQKNVTTLEHGVIIHLQFISNILKLSRY